jgi:hypothetical protein
MARGHGTHLEIPPSWAWHERGHEVLIVEELRSTDPKWFVVSCVQLVTCENIASVKKSGFNAIITASIQVTSFPSDHRGFAAFAPLPLVGKLVDREAGVAQTPSLTKKHERSLSSCLFSVRRHCIPHLRRMGVSAQCLLDGHHPPHGDMEKRQ